jgi:hypothetical protein
MEDDDKPHPFLLPRVSEAAFLELREHMKVEEDFPRTFGEWEALWDDRRREVEGDGYKPVLVDVVPEAFARWLKSRSKPGSWVTLGEFLAAKAGR